MFKPISVSLLPNNNAADILKALKLIFQPKNWVHGKGTKQLETDFENIYPGFRTISFLNGRTGLLAILNCLGIAKGDEVLLQAFTCVVVANSVIKCGAKPVYVDIDKDSFNMDPDDLARKITPKSKAIIVQHTFGYPAPVNEIVKIAAKYGLKMIEDCAHVIGASFVGKKLGTFGEAAFFSFGRDKVISSVFGGMVITKDQKLFNKLKKYHRSLSYPTRFFVFRQLLYLVLFSLILSVYNFFSLGKILLVFFQKLRIFINPVQDCEQRGILPSYFIGRIPNSLALLACFQLAKLSQFNENRQRIVKLYAAGLENLPIELPNYQEGANVFPLLRFTIKTEKAQKLYRFAKIREVILNNWYYPSISPPGVNYSVIGYDPKTCPVAEKTSPLVVNLPTHPKIGLREAKKVIKVIRQFFDYGVKTGR
ncbi:MAG TPA: aminotransferase class I/II-fold pyridoxal phosphate-dependent enzyme [Candidatus Bathyarchaeia archaeon]|nr:aminotransferase class I/II-fold pyridoxal phosphate-dependent enzyme [Candidatus Bathyarchaeia archaeon]